MTSDLPISCDLSCPASEVNHLFKLIIGSAGESRVTLAAIHAEKSTETSILLHLPVEVASDQNPAWCLVCRLACLIPTARVSVLIHGEDTFIPTSSTEAQIA